MDKRMEPTKRYSFASYYTSKVYRLLQDKGFLKYCDDNAVYTDKFISLYGQKEYDKAFEYIDFNAMQDMYRKFKGVL